MVGNRKTWFTLVCPSVAVQMSVCPTFDIRQQQLTAQEMAWVWDCDQVLQETRRTQNPHMFFQICPAHRFSECGLIMIIARLQVINYMFSDTQTDHTDLPRSCGPFASYCQGQHHAETNGPGKVRCWQQPGCELEDWDGEGELANPSCWELSRTCSTNDIWELHHIITISFDWAVQRGYL